jgi:hypothetical protein
MTQEKYMARKSGQAGNNKMKQTKKQKEAKKGGDNKDASESSKGIYQALWDLLSQYAYCF